MRIVLLAPFALAPKGTTRARALPIGRALAAAGHEVTLLVPPVDNPAQSGLSFEDGGVAVCHLRVTGETPVSRLTVPIQLARCALRLRPDLIWAFKPFGYGATTALYLRPFVRQVIQDADDWEGTGGWASVNGWPWARRRSVDLQEKISPRLADWVTVASACLRDRFTRLVASDRVVYLPNCLSGQERLPNPSAVASLRARLGIPDQAPVAVFAGYLPPENDLDLALNAVVLARREMPSLQLLLIAAGPGLDPARRRIEQLGLAGVVVETGPVAEADLPDYLGLGQVALGPYRDSIVNRARCSVKILQYLAAGRPVVATAVGENLTFVRPDRSGYLVDPGDTAGFARAIVRLIADPARAACFGAFGRADVLRRFRWADYVLPLVERWLAESR